MPETPNTVFPIEINKTLRKWKWLKPGRFYLGKCVTEHLDSQVLKKEEYADFHDTISFIFGDDEKDFQRIQKGNNVSNQRFTAVYLWLCIRSPSVLDNFPRSFLPKQWQDPSEIIDYPIKLHSIYEDMPDDTANSAETVSTEYEGQTEAEENSDEHEEKIEESTASRDCEKPTETPTAGPVNLRQPNHKRWALAGAGLAALALMVAIYWDELTGPSTLAPPPDDASGSLSGPAGEQPVEQESEEPAALQTDQQRAPSSRSAASPAPRPQFAWRIVFDGESDHGLHAIEETGDGGALLIGYKQHFPKPGQTFIASKRRLWVAKLDGQGEVQWNSDSFFPELETDQSRSPIDLLTAAHSFEDTPFPEIGVAAKELSDGQIVVVSQCGNELSSRIGHTCIIIIDSGGAVIRRHMLADFLANDADLDPAGGQLFLAGSYSDDPNGPTDAAFAAVELDGPSEFIYRFGGRESEQFNTISRYEDGTFLLAGYRALSGNMQRDFYYIRVNEDGSPLWERYFDAQGGPTAYGSDDEILDSAMRPDGHALLVGYEGSHFGGSHTRGHIAAYEIDPDGTVIVNHRLGAIVSSVHQRGTAVLPTSPGRFIVAGLKVADYHSFAAPWLAEVERQRDELGWEHYFSSTIATPTSGVAMHGHAQSALLIGWSYREGNSSRQLAQVIKVVYP